MAAPLEIAHKIAVQSWMSAPETLAVLAALEGAAPNAGERQALFVGGCVRNALLDVEVSDIDLATRLSPDQVINALDQAGIRVIPTGLAHGTVTAVQNGRSFEITTLRKDVESDGRHAIIAFSQSWLEDAQRRDFTMNTLLADPLGNIYDPLGCGVADAMARRVVFVGEADERIREDYLRILRFFRFQALYGVGSSDPAALKACALHADKIATLSRERITQEFFKIMAAEKPVDTLRLMFTHHVLKEFDSGEDILTLLEHFCTFQSRYGLVALAPRLFVLAGLSLEHVTAFNALLLIPKVFLKDMEAIAAALGMADMDNDKSVRAVLYRSGRVAAAQALMIELVQDRVMNGFAPKALSIIQSWDIPDCPVSGADLIKAGLSPGPELGVVLDRLEQCWIESDFTLDAKALLARL